jgi:hypothetical protein
MATATTTNPYHTTIVSIFVLILVTVILVSVAGTSHDAAVVVGLLFVGVTIILGIQHNANLGALAQYPAAP